MLSLVIQHIQTIWTKRSRGGPAARLRNSVPDAVLLPGCPLGSEFVLHHAIYSEYAAFSQRDVSKSSDDFADLGLKDLSYMIDDDRLTIRYHRDGFNKAKQSPYPYKDALILNHDELGRIAYNGRYIGLYTGEWWYEKHVYNVAWLSQWSLDLFISNRPQAEFQEFSKLW